MESDLSDLLHEQDRSDLARQVDRRAEGFHLLTESNSENPGVTNNGSNTQRPRGHLRYHLARRRTDARLYPHDA